MTCRFLAPVMTVRARRKPHLTGPVRTRSGPATAFSIRALHEDRATRCAPPWPTTLPTWPWWTSACRRPTPTRGCAPPSSCAAGIPGTGVLLLSQYIETHYTAQLLEHAGVGYLLKDRVADVAEFADALARVAAGGTTLDPEVVGQLL
jgi:hypothetical protein